MLWQQSFIQGNDHGQVAGFAGPADEIHDDEVVAAIRSVPTHYAGEAGGDEEQPDGGAGTATQAQTETTTTPAQQQAATGQEGTTGAAAGQANTQGAGSTGQTQGNAVAGADIGGGQSAGAFDPIAFARSVGFDAGQYSKPEDFTRDLLLAAQRARELETLAPWGQAYQQHATEFQSWMAQRGQQQAAAQPEAKKGFWQPPEWNESWSSLIKVDEKGQPTGVVPGADPTILGKYLAYEQYRRDFTQRFTRNPEETLAPMIQARAEEIAEKAVQKHLQGYQDRVYANQMIESNRSWLQAHDQAGNPLRNLQGQPMLSAEGKLFVGYVQEASSMGLNVQQQEAYAKKLLRADLIAQQHAAAGAVTTSEQQKQALLNQANRNPSQAGSTVGGATGLQNPPAQNANLSLAEQMAQAFAQAGVNDANMNV